VAADPRSSASVPGLGRFQAGAAFAPYANNPDLEQRSQAIAELLPPEAGLWLDAGSGPGIAGRTLESLGRTVVSLDASRAALRLGPPRPLCGSVDRLPFADLAFDGAICLEVLEHLPEPTLRGAVRELARVARRSLLIGVPHRENLARNALRCPRCGEVFNRSGHLHRFTESSLAARFPGFRAARRWTGGPRVRDYPRPLLWLRHRVAHRYSEMSGWPGNRCPRCDEDQFPAFRHNLLSFALDGMNRAFHRRRPYWLLVLFEREP
jgi:uncharacterized C2H2 Zn-finger protein